MNTSMTQQRVVVTAGAQGIGLAITGAFVAAGAQVHICDINNDFLAAAKAKFPAVSQSRTDVSDEAQVDAMFAELSTRWGGLDVLVNNAGIAGPTAKVEDTDLTEWSQTIAVNLTGPFLCTRRAVPLLKAAGGGSNLPAAGPAAPPPPAPARPGATGRAATRCGGPCGSCRHCPGRRRQIGRAHV